MSDTTDHYVYRCFDDDGRLLYVGCTKDVARRMYGHGRADASNSASWWLSVCMDRYEVEGPFADRAAGLAAERNAIQAENPLFNTQWQPSPTGWLHRSRVANYLIAKGHHGIAADTTCNCERISPENVVTCPAHVRHGGRFLEFHMRSRVSA